MRERDNERDNERERQRQRDRDRDRNRETMRETERQRQRQRNSETMRERQRERERHKVHPMNTFYHYLVFYLLLNLTSLSKNLKQYIMYIQAVLKAQNVRGGGKAQK